MQIVAFAPAYGHNERKGLAPTASTANALLVVESLRRHVGLEHRPQIADVDAHLHGGSHG